MPDTRTIRSTTLGLMLVIAGLAILLAILRHGIEHWGHGELLTLNMGILVLASIPMAKNRLQFRRAFWDGFAIFGWFYLFVALGPAPWNGVHEAPPLPMTRFFDVLYPRLYPEAASLFRREDPWTLQDKLEAHRLRFHQSCHSIGSLLCGCLGGILFQILAACRKQRRERGSFGAT